jgi:hypothetical protein
MYDFEVFFALYPGRFLVAVTPWRSLNAALKRLVRLSPKPVRESPDALLLPEIKD